MKVALVHDWLIHMRGGEKVLEALAEVYPDATIYTLFHRRSKLSPSLQRMRIKVSFLHYLPGIRHYYRWLLPILPWAIRTLQLEDEKLVISSSHCVAKGVKVPEKAVHFCYCHTPMRYLWGFEDDYFKKFPFPLRFFIRFVLGGLRKWDLASNGKVDFFISNSENVRERIQRYYERDAEVIYPPLDIEKFYPVENPGDYYLVVSAFVPYKKIDIVIQAFNSLDRQLMIVGSGPLANEYRKLRKSEKISFLGAVSNQALRELYAGAKALIFPTFEDFGIVPLEAQACGSPVIAYKKGGALESVKSGHFFEEQTPEAIQNAVLEFEQMPLDRSTISAKVKDFGKQQFKDRIRLFVEASRNLENEYVART